MVRAKFSIGQVVSHLLYGYQGVIIDADPCFSLSEVWYERMANSKPCKNQPWYHLLVHNSDIQTYVPERSLIAIFQEKTVHNPKIKSYFKSNQTMTSFDCKTLN